MTAMLGCDGCGSIATDRGDDPTREWFALSVGPAIGATGMLPTIDFSAVAIDLGSEDPAELEVDAVEPDRHFCSLACLTAWAQRALDAYPAPCPHDPDGMHHIGCGCDDEPER